MVSAENASAELMNKIKALGFVMRNA